MILEILVAQYKETEEIIKPLLDSIAIQQGIDFKEINVIIANDGSDVILKKEFLEQYSFHINYLLKEHNGLSGTRNFLLDNSTADYLMFCDADDMFLSNIALNLVFSEIKKNKFDYFYSDFMQERKGSSGNMIYSVLKNEPHVHGKIFRRQFLIDKNIHWKNELLHNDAIFFTHLCKACAEPNKIKYCQYPFYLWKYNKNSVTQETNYWFLKNFNYFMLAVINLEEELLARGLLDNARTAAVSFIYMVYFLYNSEDWQLKENQEYVKNVLQSFSFFYKTYSSLINLCNEKELAFIIKNARLDIAKRQKSTFLEKITFEDWKKMILEISNNGGDQNG